MKPATIIPAILAKNKKDFIRQWNKVSSVSSYLQIDISDGLLVKPKTQLRPSDIKNLSKRHSLEIHLMVKDVSRYILAWQKLANAKRIIWHYEAETDRSAILCLNQYLKKQKIKTGLSINPDTPLKRILDLVKYFDTIQIMGVNPGKQGQKFQNTALAKMKRLRRQYPKINIEADGGVNDRNFQKIKNAGANLFILGSYLQKAPDVKKALAKLKNPTP